MIERDYKYKICTRCFTYNQAAYIKDALNGFAAQETSFPVITLVVDDASTDGEIEIIRNYLKEHFQEPYRKEETEYAYIIGAHHKINKNCFFVVFLLKYNHKSIQKDKLAYLSEWQDNTKYIAVCEGDDYWISKDKLQKQFDYLESHKQCGLVYTKAKVLSEESGKFTGFVGEDCESFSELLLKNSIPTLTVMYRTDIYYEYYDKVVPNKKGWKMGDYPRWLYITANRDIHFIDEVTSVYRANEGSASRPASYEAKLDYLESSKKVRLFFCEQFNRKDQLKAIERYYEESCVMASIQYKKKKEGIRIIIKSKYLSLPRKVILFGRLIKA